MNKNLTIILASSALLILGGCTQKAPVLGDTKSKTAGELNTTASTANADGMSTGNMINIKDGENGGTLGRTPNGASEMNGGSVYNSSSAGYSSLYFDVNSYGISSDMQTRIDKNVANLTKNPSNIKIEGNCDESGTDEYNFALGLKRAKAIKDAMISKGASQSSISIVSLGESTPVCSDGTEECNMRNRRVDIKKVD